MCVYYRWVQYTHFLQIITNTIVHHHRNLPKMIVVHTTLAPTLTKIKSQGNVIQQITFAHVRVQLLCFKHLCQFLQTLW
jgi:hypothetical protein